VSNGEYNLTEVEVIVMFTATGCHFFIDFNFLEDISQSYLTKK